eukprot:s1739_g20.t1
MSISPVPGSHSVAAETYAQDDHPVDQNMTADSEAGAPPIMCQTNVSDENLDFKLQSEMHQSVCSPDINPSEKPVIHRSVSAEPEQSRFCSQEPPASTVPEVTCDRHHGQLTRAQATLPPVEQESIEHLTIADLKDEPMTFGRTHLGKSFEEMWCNHPDWIRWFAAHYHTSGKIEHRKMVHYIYLKIEEAEGTTGQTQMPVPKAKGAPKSLAARPKSGAAASASTTRSWEVDTETEMFEMMSEAPWIAQDTETKEEIRSIQDRMSNLESTLHQMMAMISQSPMIMMMSRSAPSTVAPTNPPETAWEDPWNN